jgi:hypothetical protein
MNEIIDSFCHPLFKGNPYVIILDAILHTIVEENPKSSAEKFVKCSAVTLLKELTQSREESEKKGFRIVPDQTRKESESRNYGVWGYEIRSLQPC